MSEATAPAATTALYVYGVVPAGTKLALSGGGVESTDVEVVEAGDVAAIVGVVPLEEFGAEALPRNFNDRDWLERAAQAHEAVLERALGTTTVIPFRIATLYASEDSLLEFMQERGPTMAELLQHLAGKVELGVKAYFDRERERRETPKESGAGSGPGQAYLLERQAQQAATEEADAFAIGCAQESHERLAWAALGATVNRPQPPELSGRSEQMILNGAYLVARDDTGLEDVVRGLEDRYGERGVTYEITGPWPPYNFVPRDLVGP